MTFYSVNHSIFLFDELFNVLLQTPKLNPQFVGFHIRLTAIIFSYSDLDVIIF